MTLTTDEFGVARHVPIGEGATIALHRIQSATIQRNHRVHVKLNGDANATFDIQFGSVEEAVHPADPEDEDEDIHWFSEGETGNVDELRVDFDTTEEWVRVLVVDGTGGVDEAVIAVTRGRT